MTDPTANVLVLVVDDDDLQRDVVSRQLRARLPECSVQTAAHGLEALDVLRRVSNTGGSRSAIVLLDLDMPEMGGAEFLVELRSDPGLSSTLVFVVSANDDPMVIEQVYRLGIAGFVDKLRVDGPALAELVRTYLRIVTLPPSGSPTEDDGI